MIPRARICARPLRRVTTTTKSYRSMQIRTLVAPPRSRPTALSSRSRLSCYETPILSSAAFHTSSRSSAQSPTADALMENLTELYATAKDEFEIAAEETEKKTVYAADDREAAQDALKMLQEGFAKAVKESDPEVGKEIQARVGQRIRELENAIKAMEEMAMED